MLFNYINVYSSRYRHTQTLPNKQPWINNVISPIPMRRGCTEDKS